MNVSDKKENSGFKLAQLVKSSIVEKEIWDSILPYTKNHLVYLPDNKKLSSGAGIISWNSLKKKKKDKKENKLYLQQWIEIALKLVSSELMRWIQMMLVEIIVDRNGCLLYFIYIYIYNIKISSYAFIGLWSKSISIKEC